jgi:hypothetical protein
MREDSRSVGAHTENNSQSSEEICLSSSGSESVNSDVPSIPVKSYSADLGAKEKTKFLADLA